MKTPHSRLRTPHSEDPEVAMQEHGDWFTDLVLWVFAGLSHAKCKMQNAKGRRR